MLVVVDASALLEYLLRTEEGLRLADVIESDADLHVPALCDVEVCAGLRRALLLQRMDPDRAREAVADYLDLPLTRYGHSGLMIRILDLRENFSAYDATYAALAERLDARLLTADEPFRRAVGEHLDVAAI